MSNAAVMTEVPSASGSSVHTSTPAEFTGFSYEGVVHDAAEASMNFCREHNGVFRVADAAIDHARSGRGPDGPPSGGASDLG